MIDQQLNFVEFFDALHQQHAYGGMNACICFVIMCGVIVMCGLACSCLCIVTVCLKHALTFGAFITFIDCSWFSEANTSDIESASKMNTIDIF